MATNSRLFRLLFILATCVPLHWVAGVAFAQRTTASIAGSIVDESDAAVPGAQVTIRNLVTGAERTVTSNDLGYYVLTAIPAGPYSLTITKPGFQVQ